MLLADKLIKWETGVGTEKGATLLPIINLFSLGFTPGENDLGSLSWDTRGEGEEGRKKGGMKGKGGRSRKLGVHGTEGVQQGRKRVGRGVQKVGMMRRSWEK